MQYLLEQYFQFFHTGRVEVKNTNWYFLYPLHRISLTLNGFKFPKVEGPNMTTSAK